MFALRRMTEISDDALIDAVLAGEGSAFGTLMDRYQDRVFRLVSRFTRDHGEAEDLAQEVFVQVFKAIDQFRGDAKLSTWVYRIAVNLCKNRSKYLARRHAGEQDELEAVAERVPLHEAKGVTASDVSRPDEAFDGHEVEAVVQRCIAKLEPDFREVLVLRDVEDLSYEEIAQITGLPDGTVKSRIFRARAQLKACVESCLGEKI